MKRDPQQVASRSALDEALFHLAEECCELGKAASKVYRFGPDHRKKKDGPTNKERLHDEFTDVMFWYAKVCELTQKKTPAKDNLDGGYYMGFQLDPNSDEAYSELSGRQTTTPQT